MLPLFGWLCITSSCTLWRNFYTTGLGKLKWYTKFACTLYSVHCAHCFAFNFAVRSALSFLHAIFCCCWVLCLFSLLRASRFGMAHTHLYTRYTVRLRFSVLVCISFHTYIMWYCIAYSMAASFLHFALEKHLYAFRWNGKVVANCLMDGEKKMTRQCTFSPLFFIFCCMSASLTVPPLSLPLSFFLFLCASVFQLLWMNSIRSSK